MVHVGGLEGSRGRWEVRQIDRFDYESFDVPNWGVWTLACR